MTPKVPDYGHHEADKELTALIRRLHLSYRQARINLQEKIEDYLDQFEKQDFLMRALYDSGELSHEDYMKWKYSTLAGTKQWKNMLNQLADDLTHQNEIAASMIDDTLPGVYALNHNYGTFEAEKGSGYDTTYTMYDKNTVKRLLTEHEDLLPKPSVDIPKDLLWNRQHLQSALLQGILTGESMSDIAKRFQAVTDMTERAAMRNARTAVTGAENAGRIDSYIRAKKMGIKMQQMWMATLDGRTRDSHAIMDGEQQEVGKKFSNGCRYPGDPQGAPAEVYNCFVGDTKIATESEIIRSYKHDYSGKLITIKTASGVEFTCTPNHPVFTPRGWVSANTLHKGDDVCITFVGDNHLAGSNPNIDHIFTRIDAIHEFFEKFGSKRIRSLGVNFHGDIPTSEVEIVTHKRFLKDNRNIVSDKTVEKFFFKNSDSLTLRNSHFMKRFSRIFVTTLCFMSRLRKALSLFWTRMCHAIVHRFRTISVSDSVLSQTQIDSMPCDIKFSGDGFDRPSCVIFTDNIIDVKISSVSHIPVYNLQTEKNYYFVSSIIPEISEKCNGIPMVIAHNCRCSLVAIVEGADPYNPNLRPSEYLKEEGLTYEQWKEMHGERFYSKLFENYEEPAISEQITFSDGEDANKYFGKRPERSLRRSDREEYDRQMEIYNQSSYGQWHNKLSPNQIGSIGEYCGDGYIPINGLLRHQMTEKMVEAWYGVGNHLVQDMIDEIESAIDEFELRNPLRVYRTCENDVLDNLSLKIGDRFHDDGFGSTSVLKNKVASGNIVMEIDVPSGKGLGAWVNPLSGAEDKEYEFLLQRGTDYLVKNIRYEGDDTIVSLEVVGNTRNDWSYATKEEVVELWKRRGIYDEQSAEKI